MRIIQFLAFGFLILSVAGYGPTSLNIPGLLGVIIGGEAVDRLGLILQMWGTRKDDLIQQSLLRNRDKYPEDPGLPPRRRRLPLDF